MPTETIIRQNQHGYYMSLQESREPEIDAAPFIDFMLDVIGESLRVYEVQASETAENVGINVGINDMILDLLRLDPTMSAAALAAHLGKTPRTVERYLASMRETGQIVREGSRKSGRWIVVEG